ncbi:MAG: hypothetical protein QXU82_00725 [Candidatus Aenigmatarchaeota archaeon]
MPRLPEDNAQEYKDRAEKEKEIDREVEEAYIRPDGNFYGEISRLSQKYGSREIQESLKRLRQRGLLNKDNTSIFKDGRWE